MSIAVLVGLVFASRLIGIYIRHIYDDAFITFRYAQNLASGLGFVYNASDDDSDYGTAPPAAGVDFFQGPLVDADGLDNDRDGIVDEEEERLQMTAFMRIISVGAEYESDPGAAHEYYRIMQGLWKDGVPMTAGGRGRESSTERTTFQYSGAAEDGAFWSEINIDGQGTANPANDRRFSVSSGPTRMISSGRERAASTAA